MLSAKGALILSLQMNVGEVERVIFSEIVARRYVASSSTDVLGRPLV
jgi:hypothetical protein